MIFNHMPDWLYSSKELTASAKLLMERIFTLSRDGTQPVFIARSTFAEKLGMSVRTLSNAFKELEDAGLIEDLPNTNRWDRTRNFKVTAKACLDTSEQEKFARSSEQNLQDRSGKNCNIEVEKTATSKLQNLQDREGKNCNVEVAEVASSNLQTLQDLHQIEELENKDRNKKEIRENYIYSAHDKISIATEETSQGVSLKSQEGYSENDNTPIAKIALHHTKVITNSNNQSNDLSNTIYSANTKNDTQKISYPQSAEECITLFSDYVQRYSSDAPALLNMPLRMQAETFFDYWNERGWKSQRGAVKSVKGCVATWINNWLSHNQRFTSAKPRLNTFEDHIAYGQQLAHKLGLDSDTPPKSADEILDRALELECKKIKPITDPLALEILGRKKAP